ncbi:hypothetical protein SBV1_1290008 [Verrucomicrobia bacterium]|nr:hypothetical protein SBV1_1290008 [Verrucomicrobiota bacterium]
MKAFSKNLGGPATPRREALCEFASYGPEPDGPTPKQMKQREIVINDAGVTAFESTLGLAASGHDLEIALGAEGVRDLPPLRVRQLRICDTQGLSRKARFRFRACIGSMNLGTARRGSDR